jgi:DNA polymerase-3 subunit alpha
MLTIEKKSESELHSKPIRSSYQFDGVPLDDPRVWALYQRGDVKGLFQVESQLCRQWCKKIKPSNIDELSALISLVRPGGIESGFLEKYCKIKNGEEEPSYFHPSLEPILKATHSCLVFQEAILQICISLAGFNEIQADDARRAVGKKLPEEMDKVRKMFLEGAKQKGVVDEATAEEIFSWIQKSVRYLFNAGHSYSYSYMSYFTAYQKYWFPTEFYTSALIFLVRSQILKQRLLN